MFEFKKKKINVELVEANGKNLLTHLGVLQYTEDTIHQQSKWNDTGSVIETAKIRKASIKEVKDAITVLEEDIEKLTKEKGAINKEHFDKIKTHILKIEEILKLQFEELSKKEVLFDNLARTQTIDGMNPSGESNLTYQIRTLSELIVSQAEVIARYIVEVEDEIEVEVKEKSLSLSKEDNRPIEIKKRFILSEDGETIYDNQTNLTWERNFDKSGELNWNYAMKYAKDKNCRLPTRNDFKTLALSGEYPLKIELEEIGFLNVSFSTWTSEQYFDLTTAAYIVYFGKSHHASDEDIFVEKIGKALSVVCIR